MAISTGEKTVTASASVVISKAAGVSKSLGANGAVGVLPLAGNTDSYTYFGGSDVTVANGWPVAKGQAFFFDVSQIGELYCIGVTTTDKVRWMTTGTN